MTKMTILPEDHLKGKVIPPGVYPAEVADVEEKPAKKDQSQNWNLTFRITEGEYKGVVVFKTFNEKWKTSAIPFAEACGGNIDPKKPYDLDFQKTLKCKLRIVVKNQLYDGTMRNQVDGFLPAERLTQT